MENVISAQELFNRVFEILQAEDVRPEVRNKMMHDTLVLCCHEGIRNTEQSFGNLFSQVDYLCKLHRVSIPDKIAIQTMRHHSNSTEPLSRADLLYDARALSLFISAVFSVDIPSLLVGVIPAENRPHEKGQKINRRYIRCIVESWDEDYIHASIDQDSEEQQITIKVKDAEVKIDHSYILDLLRDGTQLNLLDNTITADGKVIPRIIVFEPDYLIDISQIAACFTEYGHHPLLYLLNMMKPRANTQATLLGNFAGSALDDIINSKGCYQVNDTIKTNFKEKALEYCTCRDFDSRRFYADANTQANNLEQVVKVLFRQYDKAKAILEPSFVCESLGIQGRVDLMTTDMKLLVEQKSGRNMNIERHQMNPDYHSFQLEPHYVQLLLYYGVLHYNFRLDNNAVDIRLLYSKYPPKDGLMVVAYYQALFREAIKYRNQLVAAQFEIATDGFDDCIEEFTPDNLNVSGIDNFFYAHYLRPQVEAITAPLHALSNLERAYYSRMMTFVLREQMIAKVGAQEGTNNSTSDFWNMPVSEKKDAGNIYTDLSIINKVKSSEFNGFDTITLAVPDQGEVFLPNFRVGDMVYLYAYGEKGEKRKEPDIRHALLFKGILQEIHSDRLTVHLTDGQQNPDVIEGDRFAIEHAGSDSASASIRSLHEFIAADKRKRDLLLGQREPGKDTSLQLSRSYDPILDLMLLKAKQARDYFLLVGPPGTGKTSRALQFMVRESAQKQILLMSYTNRAVDEICEMLCDNGIPFLRIGNEFSCDEHFRPYLIDKVTEHSPKLASIRQLISQTKIIVGTTSMIASKSYIFNIKHFDLAIIDESSQILEPNLIGLLTRVDKFILIGDYKQLPAVVQQSVEDSSVSDPILTDICLDNCRKSLFERLIQWERKNGRSDFIGILRRQGRMHPDIAEFPNSHFYFSEKLQPIPLAHQLDKSISHRMIFIPSHFCRQPNISDKVNMDEARIVSSILNKVYAEYRDDFDASKTVGVIVPYRNQIAMIRREIEKLGIPELEKITVDTVERYQGSQRDVIIYSFTVQNFWQIEFLTSNSFVEDGHLIDRKLNVAITRARKQMIMTGNPTILSSNLIFRQLIEFCKAKGGYIEQI